MFGVCDHRRYAVAVAEARATVKITEPDFAGSYVVTEQRSDGSLVLAPETVDQVVAKFADRPLSEAEQDEMFDRLDAAADHSSAPTE
jgi:hypothetical protein